MILTRMCRLGSRRQALPVTTRPLSGCHPTQTEPIRLVAAVCYRGACRTANTRQKNYPHFLHNWNRVLKYCIPFSPVFEQSQRSTRSNTVFIDKGIIMNTLWFNQSYLIRNSAQWVSFTLLKQTLIWNGPIPRYFNQVFHGCISRSLRGFKDPDVRIVVNLVQFFLRIINLTE